MNNQIYVLLQSRVNHLRNIYEDTQAAAYMKHVDTS